jgi:hypothetical protein
LYFDSTRFIIDDENAGIESDSEFEDDFDELPLCEDWENEDLQESLIRMAVNEGDNPLDENWLPDWLKMKKRKKRTGHGEL